jgi:hypothetical protein
MGSGKIRHGDIVICYKEEGSNARSLGLTNNIPKLRPLDLARYLETKQVTSCPSWIKSFSSSPPELSPPAILRGKKVLH